MQTRLSAKPSGCWLLALLATILAACAKAPSQTAPQGRFVQTGLDVLVAEDFARLRGKRLALITNRSSISSTFERSVDLFHASANAELVRVLTPEHGFGADAEGDIPDGREAGTGLPLFSLYGDTRRPTTEMLTGIDAIVFDVQDVGTRFYTYATTLGYAMEEAGRAGVEVIVVDRPNPIGGDWVRGPLSDEERRSFINYQPMPLVHGLTLGELAHFYRGEFGVECELEVVPLQGWTRDMRFEDTGLPWANPSPNIRNPNQALLYPGIGVLEACNLSVGRGTDQPFERLGAPWIDAVAWARDLRALGLPGVALTPIQFVPQASAFEGELCQGLQISILEASALRPVELGFALAWTLERAHPDEFEQEKVLDRLLAGEAFERLFGSDEPAVFSELAGAGVREYLERRRPYLLYE